MLKSKSQKLKAIFQTELHPISIGRARVDACDHSLSSSISGKSLVGNGSALPEFSYVQELLTKTAFLRDFSEFLEDCFSIS